MDLRLLIINYYLFIKQILRLTNNEKKNFVVTTHIPTYYLYNIHTHTHTHIHTHTLTCA